MIIAYSLKFTDKLVKCIDFMKDSELRQSVKIVKEEVERESMCFKAKRIAYSSVVRTLDSGGCI